MAHPNLNTDQGKSLAANVADLPPDSPVEPRAPSFEPAVSPSVDGAVGQETPGQETPGQDAAGKVGPVQRPELPAHAPMTSPIANYDTDRYRLVRPFTTRL